MWSGRKKNKNNADARFSPVPEEGSPIGTEMPYAGIPMPAASADADS
jgi:hypothetical protein